MKSAQQTTSSKARIEKSESKKKRKERSEHCTQKVKLFRATTRNLKESPPQHLGAPPPVYLYTVCLPARKREPRAINRPCSPCRLDPSQGPAARSVSSPSFPISVFCLLMARSSKFRLVKRSSKQPRPHKPAQRLTGPSTRNVLRERFQHRHLANHRGTNLRRHRGVVVLGVLEFDARFRAAL